MQIQLCIFLHLIHFAESHADLAVPFTSPSQFPPFYIHMSCLLSTSLRKALSPSSKHHNTLTCIRTATHFAELTATHQTKRIATPLKHTATPFAPSHCYCCYHWYWSAAINLLSLTASSHPLQGGSFICSLCEVSKMASAMSHQDLVLHVMHTSMPLSSQVA
jgi:hypothetical protein